MSLNKMEPAPKYALIAEVTVSLPLQCLGLGLLLKNSLKKPVDLMLIFMSLVELLLIIFSLTSFQNVNILKSLPLDLVIAISVGYILNFTMVVITVDRALAVKLPLRYRIIVTKKRTVLSFICGIFLGLLVCISFYHTTPRNVILITVFMNYSVCLILLFSYIYIVFKVKHSQAAVANNSSGSLTLFRYHIPICIGVTYIGLHLIPSFMRAAGFNFGDWIIVIWNLNFICDPLIYTLGCKKSRTQLHSLLCAKNSSVQCENGASGGIIRYSRQNMEATAVCAGCTKKEDCAE